MGWFESQGWKDRWPLQYAAMKGDVLSIIRLVENDNVSPDVRQTKSLYSASFKKILAWCIYMYVQVKMTDWYDSHACGWAASFGQLGALRCLVDLGADPMAVNKANDTAFTDAKREKHNACIDYMETYIKSHSCNTSQLHGSGSNNSGLLYGYSKVSPSPHDLDPKNYTNPPGAGPRPDQVTSYFQTNLIYFFFLFFCFMMT